MRVTRVLGKGALLPEKNLIYAFAFFLWKCDRPRSGVWGSGSVFSDDYRGRVIVAGGVMILS